MKVLQLLITGITLLFSAAAWSASVDINAASADRLATELDGVGDKKAAAIVRYRTDNGPFARGYSCRIFMGFVPPEIRMARRTRSVVA